LRQRNKRVTKETPNTSERRIGRPVGKESSALLARATLGLIVVGRIPMRREDLTTQRGPFRRNARERREGFPRRGL
jgi:hypothetical protein